MGPLKSMKAGIFNIFFLITILLLTMTSEKNENSFKPAPDFETIH